MAVQLTDAEVRLVVCESTGQAASIVLDQRVDRGDWVSLVDSPIAADIAGALPLILNADTVDSFQAPTVREGVEFGVIVELADGSYLTSGFTLPETSKLEDGAWLGSDGVVGPNPCG